MKLIKRMTVVALVAAFALAPLGVFAAEQTKENAKPYPLKTCIVTGEKLGDMGEAYTFVHEGQEFKLCCKGCLKDFNKNPAKYVKKLKEEEAKAKAKK
jgi:YHS domain-containing protein